MSNLLFELYCEDIPATLQNNCADSIEKYLLAELSTIAKYDEISVWCNLNRIGVYLKNITISPQDKKGPSTAVKSEIIDFFCKSNNITKDKLYIKTISKKDFFFFSYTPQIHKIINKIFALPLWPEGVKWPQSNNKSWITPIRNILYIHENNHKYSAEKSHIQTNKQICSEQISFGQIQSSQYTIINSKKVLVSSIQEYFNFLKNIPLKFTDRATIINKQLHNIEQSLAVTCITATKTLEESINLNISPKIITGKIPEKLTTLPLELIQLTLEKNQKYLIFQCNKTKKLSHYFGIITEEHLDSKRIAQGYIQVATARLEDAIYLYQLDLKQKSFLQEEKLKNIFINSTLGTLHDKIQRLSHLNNNFKNILSSYNNNPELQKNIEQTIKLYKNDLTTNLVQEFPELQGIIGSYFAQYYNYNKQICEAIYKQYQHQVNTHAHAHQHHHQTNNIILDFINILNYIDTLTGMFLAGIRPTSSKDPYGLRRAASILNQALSKYDIYIEELIDISIQSFDQQPSNQTHAQTSNQTHIEELKNFIIDRFHKANPCQYLNIIKTKSNKTNFKEIVEQIHELQSINLSNILQAYHRINKLTQTDLVQTNKNQSNTLQTKKKQGNLQQNIDIQKYKIQLPDTLNNKDYFLSTITLKSLDQLSITINKYIDNNFISNDINKLKDLLYVKINYFDKLYNFANIK